MAPDFGTTPGGSESTLNSFFENVKKAFDIGAEDFASAITRLTQSAVEINKTFTQGRQRIVELQQSVADAVPNVNRLGGQLSDVTSIISQVAEASRRNVIANTKDVEQLYAATKVLGMQVGEIESLSNAFLDVGYSIGQVGESLQKSVNYVQSIGGNAKAVIDLMTKNMEQLNRYQFEGGVKGLTKMAAQASMLRFDMNQTFQLAERVLSPEGAIETASAFQRLGVAVGGLADPFQLMNQSINDPSGLQDSLAKVARQFTYFDEKTKTFKINPQGVLTLKEMETQTGVSAREMAKMGLAAAEMDKRISEVNKAGLRISSEEDRQYLANIAAMGEGGKFEVKVKDEQTGKLITKELSQVTQDEFDKLIKEQKEGPKTLEELTRSQMGIQEIIQNDLAAIKNKVVGGISTPTQALTGLEGARRLTDVIAGELSKAGSAKGLRDKTEDFINGLDNLRKDLADPKKNTMEVLSQYGDKFGGELKKAGIDLANLFSESMEKAGLKLSQGSGWEKNVAPYLSKASQLMRPETTTTSAAGTTISKEVPAGAKTTTQPYGTTSTGKYEMNGNFSIDVNFKGDQSFTPEQKQELTKVITETLRSLANQRMVVDVSTPKDPTKAPR